MEPRKKRRRSLGQEGRQAHKVSLQDLPLPAAALIYQQLDAESRQTLVSVSRWARDTVLREARSIKLQVHSKSPRKPLMRFLERACTAAEAGRLSLALDAHGFESKGNLLSGLLAPSSKAGWASVRELSLKTFPSSGTPAKLVSTAFPALQKLDLHGMSLTYKDLSSLAACSQLFSLRLSSCQVQQTRGNSNISPLSAMCSLRQLSLEHTAGSIAAGLSQLRGLTILGCMEELMDERLVHISGLTQLQDLTLSDAREILISADTVRHILTARTQLTRLHLLFDLRQAEFDTLLTHATQLTSLTCRTLYLQEDRSAWPCSWKELAMLDQLCNGQTLAYIPTDSLTRLAFENFQLPSPSPALEFRAYHFTETASLPELMRRGLTKLARCPAWQGCGPLVKVTVCADGRTHGISPEVVRSMLGALAPLPSMQVQLFLASPGVGVGASAMQELGTALGTRLQQLVLKRCGLEEDFWPAVWAHLPGLHMLRVGDDVYGAVDVHAITFFCSHARRPLRLTLGRDLYEEVGPADMLEKQCRVWGVPQVTVVVADI